MKKILYIGESLLKKEIIDITSDRNMHVFDPESLGSAKILMSKIQFDLIILEKENNNLVLGTLLNEIFNNLNDQKIPLLVISQVNGKAVITNIWLRSEKKCMLSFEGEMSISEYLN